MADFLTAIKDGVRAAELAERARAEIDQVFADLNQQMQDFSNGKVFVARMEFPLTDEFGEPIEDNRGDIVTEPGIGLHTSKRKQRRCIANWTAAQAGYPCKIRTEYTSYTCDDKAGLETSLAELLRDPKVGEAIQFLMNVEK